MESNVVRGERGEARLLLIFVLVLAALSLLGRGWSLGFLRALLPLPALIVI